MVLDKLQSFKTQAMDGGELSRPAGADSTVQAEDLRDRDFQKILLIKLSAMGDVVQTFPVLNALRRRYPDARLDWLTTPGIAELLRHNPAISSVIEFQRDDWSTPWRLAPYVGSARLLATLRAAKYDLVLDLQGQLRSAVFAYGSGAPVRIGFDKPRAGIWDTSPRKIPDEAKKHAWRGAREGSWLAYTDRITLPTLDMHPVERYLRIAPMLGLGDERSGLLVSDSAGSSDPYRGIAGLLRHRQSAAGCAGAGHELGNKALARRRFRRSGAQSGAKGQCRGPDRLGPGERALREEIAKLSPGTVNLAGETTLSELAALIRRATICVTNDSGPMHLAVALDRPVVSVFGPTDPVWAGPYRATAR